MWIIEFLARIPLAAIAGVLVLYTDGFDTGLIIITIVLLSAQITASITKHTL